MALCAAGLYTAPLIFNPHQEKGNAWGKETAKTWM